VQFLLRPAQGDDFETLWTIDQQCFEPGISYSRFELKLYMRRRGAFTILAESAETHEIVGFLVGECGRRGTGHIITIDVLSKVRRHGLGSRLLDAAEERMRTDRCSSVVLETAVDNQDAISFYKSRFYLVTGTIPRYYSNGVDAFVFTKVLAAGRVGASSVGS